MAVWEFIEDETKFSEFLDPFVEQETDPTFMQVLILHYKNIGDEVSKKKLLGIAIKAESRGDDEIAKSARESAESL